MPASSNGYLLLRPARTVIAEYDASAFAKENAPLLAELRRAVRIDVANYRGIARQPLEPLHAAQLSLIAPANSHARLRLAAVCDEDDVIPRLEHAREIASLVDGYEIVRVEAGQFSDEAHTLGYDIGYWGGDHFSVIADIAVTPRWHPPPPEEFGELASRLRALNEHVLFPSSGGAAEFLDEYRSREWAESAGDFAIIRVAVPE